MAFLRGPALNWASAMFAPQFRPTGFRPTEAASGTPLHKDGSAELLPPTGRRFAPRRRDRAEWRLLLPNTPASGNWRRRPSGPPRVAREIGTSGSSPRLPAAIAEPTA